ncbi:MAG: hypothetical protein JW801_05805 [Bacteroidales bacterium]|nr:hypothetical protein [Bacteroidales bacterium]
MKVKNLIIYLALITFLGALSACGSAEKASKQRQNLMMPEKSDLPRNSRYQPAKKKKTYKNKYSKKKKHSGIFELNSPATEFRTNTAHT